MRDRTAQSITAWLFLLPGLAGLTLFFLLPFGSIVYLSLTNWNLFQTPRWVGLDNFLALAADPRFRAALGQTILVTACTVPLSLAGGLALALLVNRRLRGTRLFRAIYFVPAVLYTFVVAIVGDLVLQLIATWWAGLTGSAATGAFPVPLVASLVLVTAYKWVGFDMVILLAGLRQIPTEVADAAVVDGATGLQRLWRVTLPQLAPSLLLAGIMTTILTATAFDQGAVLGEARRSASMIVVFIYDNLFAGMGVPRGGYAAASALLLAVLLAGATLLQSRLLRRWLEGSTEGVQ